MLGRRPVLCQSTSPIATGKRDPGVRRLSWTRSHAGGALEAARGACGLNRGRRARRGLLLDFSRSGDRLRHCELRDQDLFEPAEESRERESFPTDQTAPGLAARPGYTLSATLPGASAVVWPQ